MKKLLLLIAFSFGALYQNLHGMAPLPACQADEATAALVGQRALSSSWVVGAPLVASLAGYAFYKATKRFEIPENGRYNSYTSAQFNLMSESIWDTFKRSGLDLYKETESWAKNNPNKVLFGMMSLSSLKDLPDKLLSECGIPKIVTYSLPFGCIGAVVVKRTCSEIKNTITPLRNKWKDEYRAIQAFNPYFSVRPEIEWIGPIAPVIQDYINLMSRPVATTLYQLKPQNGFLLHGEPGNGKTLMAKEIANRMNAAFLEKKPSDILNMYIGKSEQAIDGLLSEVCNLAKDEKKQRGVLFFDEIEGLFPDRTFQGAEVSGQVFVSITNSFLKVAENAFSKNVLIIGATNHLEKVDPALRRSGRLEEILVAMPDEGERKDLLVAYFNRHFGKTPDDGVIQSLVKNTQNFSRADIMASVRNYAIKCAKEFDPKNPQSVSVTFELGDVSKSFVKTKSAEGELRDGDNGMYS